MKIKIEWFFTTHNCDLLKTFAQNWYKERKRNSLDGEINYKPNYVVSLLQGALDTGQITKTKNRGGGEKKVNKDVLKCLICTVFDFPKATDAERTAYFNTYGPCQEKSISEKIVNRLLNENMFKTNVPCFSPKDRNTFGAMVLRYLWADVMKKIQKDSLIVFIDETAVFLGRKKRSARGFYSVVPIVNKLPHSLKKMTILTAIIPNFDMC